MNPDEFRSEVSAWLQETGKIQEMQTRLRRDVIQMLQRPKQSRATLPTKPPDDRQRALNSLVMEQLVNSGMWFTASVFASEAGEFAHKGKIPDVDHILRLKDHGHANAAGALAEPHKLPDEALEKCLRSLDLPRWVNSDKLRLCYYRSANHTLFEVLLEQLSSSPESPDEVGQLLQRLNHVEGLLQSGSFQPKGKSRDNMALLHRLHRLKSNLGKESPTKRENFDGRANSSSEEEQSQSGTRSSSSEGSEGLSDGMTSSAPSQSAATAPRVRSDRSARQMEDQLSQLRLELSRTHQELELARANESELSNIRLIVDSQKQELVRLRSLEQHHVATTAGQGADSNAPSQPVFREFVSDARSKLDNLMQSSMSIEKEFAKLK